MGQAEDLCTDQLGTSIFSPQALYVVGKLLEMPVQENLTAEERITRYINALELEPGLSEQAKAALHRFEMEIGHMHAGSGFFAFRERQTDTSQPTRYYSAFGTPAPLKHAVKINDMEIAIRYLCDKGLEKDYSVHQLSRLELFGVLDGEEYARYCTSRD